MIKLLRLLSILVAVRVGGAQQIDTARALAGLRDAATACTLDDSALWGKSLCGPIALVDRQTRLVIANDTAAGARFLPYAGAHVTVLPAGQFIANTSFKWSGRAWTMVALPLPADRYDRLRLLMHEVMHREQEALGLRASDPLNNHLDFRDGRTWLRLELRALAAALTAADEAAREHVRDALLFRAMRGTLFPASDSLESLLEIQEGLPEYTGHALARRVMGDSTARIARDLADFATTRPTLVRSFAYGTGPALGLLLDRFAANWRTRVRARRDLAALLRDAVQFRAPSNLQRAARDRAAAYGWREIDRSEATRDSLRAPVLRAYRERFVLGRTITLTQSKDSLNWGFDPNSLIAFDLTHAVYPFGSFSASWGVLTVSENGVLVRNDLTEIRIGLEQTDVDVDVSAREIKGRGWTLTINTGWELRPDPRNSASLVLGPRR
jgi:hypothetical protein